MSTATHSSSGSHSSTKSESAPKSTKKADIPAAPPAGPFEPGLNDRRADGEPVLGHFVEVTGGEHEGRYGIFDSLSADGTAVVTSRDEHSERIVVKFSDLVASRSGKR